MRNEARNTQIAAYLLQKSGGTMNYLKLLKLMYLVEREYLAKTGAPLTTDHLVSMDNGPVLSETYDSIKASNPQSVWGQWIEKTGYTVRLLTDIASDQLDELNRLSREILDEIWRQFGHMNQWNLVEYTHQHCAEWQDPEGSSLPIRYCDLFEAVGYSPDQAQQLSDEIEAAQALDRVFAAF